MQQDIRWIQRYINYCKAFKELEEAVQSASRRELNKLEKQGLIQGFEYTHELAWNVMKDFLDEQGISGLMGSKDSTRAAFKAGLISSGETWMDMIVSRNLSSHTYNEDLAEKIVHAIITLYYPLFKDFMLTMAGAQESGSL
jgi:nucleotidyltransferase substrate binding protein (TIGR01987 family)